MFTTQPAPPCLLSIAGSDSGGGAGIQADLKTFTALGGYGLTVLTALTAQNTKGVSAIFPVAPDFAAEQLRAVLEDFPVSAAKTGMLFSAGVIHALAPILKTAGLPLVVDPVCVSQSGHKLLEDDALRAMMDEIIPLASLVTPNRPEAEALTGIRIRDESDILQAMERLLGLGAQAVLLKGGHFNTSSMTDWLLIRGSDPLPVRHERVATENTHGTGCTLSSAITALLGRGMDLTEAVRRGISFLHRSLEQGFDLGHGQGPVNHLAGLSPSM